MQTFPEKTSHWLKNPTVRNLIFFSTIIFFYALGDALMAFMAPNIIEDYVKNTFFMGIIFSASSFVGYFVDLSLGNYFTERSFYSYLVLGILAALLFPLLLILVPSTVIILVLSMALWGIYFELINFSKSNFVHHSLTHDNHDLGWATLYSFSNLAYLLGPSLAVLLLGISKEIPLVVALILQLVGLVAALIYRKACPIETSKFPSNTVKPNLRLGFSTWKLFNKKMWPILLFTFSMLLFDATFYTIGSILVVSESKIHPSASLLFVFYILPSLFLGPVGIKLSRQFGKKRTSFVSGLFAGILYFAIFLTREFTVFMWLVGIGSIGISIAFQEIRGAIEDYCERLGASGNSLVGLISSMGSLAFIVGPILAGSIASFVGEMYTFAIMGFIIIICSIIALLFVPRKVRMPQAEIQELYTH